MKKQRKYDFGMKGNMFGFENARGQCWDEPQISNPLPVKSFVEKDGLCAGV